MCFLLLLLKDEKHNSLSWPVLEPRRERIWVLNCSVISCISLSISLTNLAAKGSSWTKSWFRMWSINWIIFFLVYLKLLVVYSLRLFIDAFSRLSCNILVVGNEYKEISLYLFISVLTILDYSDGNNWVCLVLKEDLHCLHHLYHHV